ncbi:Complement receptor type 2 [Toxocara canis]|uniref:Complement receptor type 2 n=1 Tax=Toxocara canis TaxID=6265 RepID=A0A0B2VE18_TOXCA|nr:Complement receptor type 2 [Toxocara canis]
MRTSTVTVVLLTHTIITVHDALERVEYEDYDYLDQPDDYGDEKLLWGKELNPQWCDPPLLNDTFGDRFSVRNSFINPNSKGQYATEALIEMRCGDGRRLKLNDSVVHPLYATEALIEMRCGDGRRLKLNDSVVHPLQAAYLRCTLSTLALRGEWALIGMLDYMASFMPSCTSEAATLVICDIPQLNPNEILIDEAKKARFYKHNETLALRCARKDDRLLPNGNHTLRCDNSGWVYEVNRQAVGDKSPVCVAHSRCTLKQIPNYLLYSFNGSICNNSGERCPSIDEALPVDIQDDLMTKLSFWVTLSCKSQSLRLNGRSEATCVKSQVIEGSVWYPTKWPLCSLKLNCLTPYIHLGDYIAEDSSRIFRPGSRVKFECFEEHKLIGSPIVECTDVGYWNDTLPTCVEAGQMKK